MLIIGLLQNLTLFHPEGPQIDIFMGGENAKIANEKGTAQNHVRNPRDVNYVSCVARKVICTFDVIVNIAYAVQHLENLIPLVAINVVT